MFQCGTHFTAESPETMRIKCLSQGHNILMQPVSNSRSAYSESDILTTWPICSYYNDNDDRCNYGDDDNQNEVDDDNDDDYSMQKAHFNHINISLIYEIHVAVGLVVRMSILDTKG